MGYSNQASEFSILHRKRSPSFHMEGGLGLCVVVMLIYNIDNIHEGDGVNVKAR